MKVKMGRRIIVGLILVVTLVAAILTPQTTYAAKAKTVEELEKSLEKQYGISIIMSKEFSKSKSALWELELLEDSLNAMPNGLIKALVKHFKSKGKATTIAISISHSIHFNTAPASYNYNTNTINLFVPKGSTMWASGTHEYSVTHEFGHMLQNSLNDLYGSRKLKSDFISFNGKKEYGGKWKNGHELVFVRDYATTKFEEDFAETFAASVTRSELLREIYNDKENAAIIKKSAYIKKIIEKQLKVKMSQNDWMIYAQKPSKKFAKTINSATYTGIRFEYTGAYQYKIKEEIFYKELQYTLSSAQDESEYVEYVPKKINNGKYIKRKDAALILADAMKHANILEAPNKKVIFTDCGDLTKKYNSSIKKVANAGLMLTTKDDKFSPESYCSYEQVYYALIQLQELIG